MPVDPTAEDIRALAAVTPDGPIAMLNLLKFVPGGRASYEQYARRAAPFLERHGAQVLYFGDCLPALVAPDTHDWDAILLVRYPSRAAFVQMISDPGYRAITGLRSAALQSAVLQPTAAAI